MSSDLSPDAFWQDIRTFLTSFNALTGANIGIHDRYYAVAIPSGGVEGTLCAYCKEKCPAFLERCYCEDNEHMEEAENGGEYTLWRCHLGMMSLIIPIRENGTTVGLVDFGMIRPIPDESMEFEPLFRRLCREYPDSFSEADREAMSEAYRKTAAMTEETVKHYANLVKFAVRGLYVNRLFGGNRMTSEVSFRIYLDFLNAAYLPLAQLSAAETAKRLNISYSNLAHLSQTVLGMSFKQYVLKKKVEAGARILLSEHKTVRETAAMVGVDDPRYFSRLFKREMGCTCKEYLAKHAGEGN